MLILSMCSVVDQTDAITYINDCYSPPGPPDSVSLIVLIIAAAGAGGFLLILAAVGIFCICRKCKNKLAQEIKQ